MIKKGKYYLCEKNKSISENNTDNLFLAELFHTHNGYNRCMQFRLGKIYYCSNDLELTTEDGNVVTFLPNTNTLYDKYKFVELNINMSKTEEIIKKISKYLKPNDYIKIAPYNIIFSNEILYCCEAKIGVRHCYRDLNIDPEMALKNALHMIKKIIIEKSDLYAAFKGRYKKNKTYANYTLPF